MSSMLILIPLLIAAALMFFYVVRRSDYKVPKEIADVRIKSKSEQNGVYVFVLDAGGAEKTLKTKDAYYSRLEPGQRGRLAYRGNWLLDFEVYRTPHSSQ